MPTFQVIDTGSGADTFYEGMVKDAANWATLEALVPVGTTASQTLTNKTLTTPIINCGSDATGDIYYRNGTTFTRLAKGTALQVLRMNAAATAPEWSAPRIFEAYTATRAMDAATGSVDYSLVNSTLTPVAVIINATIDGVSHTYAPSMGMGHSASKQYCILGGDNAGVSQFYADRIVYREEGADGTKTQSGALASTCFAAGKVTIDWTRSVAAPTSANITLQFLVFF